MNSASAPQQLGRVVGTGVMPSGCEPHGGCATLRPQTSPGWRAHRLPRAHTGLRRPCRPGPVVSSHFAQHVFPPRPLSSGSTSRVPLWMLPGKGVLLCEPPAGPWAALLLVGVSLWSPLLPQPRLAHHPYPDPPLCTRSNPPTSSALRP